MKKILMLASLLFCTQTIFAQLEKGMIAVGLSSEISTNKRTNETYQPSSIYNSKNVTKTTTFQLGPNVSYFLSNKFAVGLGIGYSGYKTITENSNSNRYSDTSVYIYTKTTSAGMSISPYVKYYIPLNDNIFFYIRGGISTTFSSGKTSGYTDNSSIDGFGNVLTSTRSKDYGPNKTNTTYLFAGISPGVLFMPSNKVGIEFSLGSILGYSYQIAKTTNNTGGGKNKSTTDRFQFLDFSTFSLGTSLYYFF